MNKIINNAEYIRVSPGIGMARVGNSEDYFIGPEKPDSVPTPNDGLYKDKQGALKPQAQRFRVFAYDSENKLIDEIVNGDTVNGTVVALKWDVHVTNMKAANYAFQGKYGFNSKQLRNSTIQNNLPPAQRDRLIIDPGLISIKGNQSGPVELIDNQGKGSVIFDVEDLAPTGGFTLPAAVQFDPPQISTDPTAEIPVKYKAAKVSLGNLYTDAVGRLIFVGGKGSAASCTTPAVVLSKIPTLDNDLKNNPEYNGNSYFNNPGWYDDTCGGSVNVELTNSSGSAILSTQDQADLRGWVAVAPPNYSPATNNVVSLLDLQLDIYPEADPYTGKGPLTIASNASDHKTYIGESSDGIHFRYSPISGSILSNQKPSVTLFKGITYVVIIAENNQLYIANSQESYVFTAITLSVKTSLAPALTVFNNVLHMAIIAQDGLPYIATSSTGKATDFNVLPVNNSVLLGAPTSSFSPAIIAYEGFLIIAYISVNQEILLAVRDNQSQNYNTQKIGQAEIAKSGPSLSFFRGKLAITYNDKNLIQLATAFFNNDSDVQNDFNFELVASVPSTSGLDSFSPSISYFNNKLYLTNVNEEKDIVLGVSTDAKSFTFNNVGPGLTILGGSGLCTDENVNFYRDIYPILRTVTDYAWTNERAFHGHRPGSQGDFLRDDYLQLLSEPSFGKPANNSKQPNTDARVFVYDFIRPPAEVLKHPIPAPPVSAPKNITSNEDQRIDLMPRLYGNGGSPEENLINDTNFPNQWLSLTNNQLAKFQRWVNGDFIQGTLGEKRWQDIPKPDQLDFAALQPTVGGGFHPGIELTYLMHESVFFASAFRFAQETAPGSIAGYMSVPWHGDFWSCNTSWWPAIRPDVVIQRSTSNPPVLNAVPWFRSAEIPPYSDGISDYNGGYQNMAHNWHKYGIVVPVAGLIDQGQQVYEESQRDPSLDTSTLIASLSVNNTANGQILFTDNSQVGAQQGNGSEPSQQWQLVPFSGSPDYFYIQSQKSQTFLTSDASQVSLSPLNVPHNDSQLWQYLPSGYPGSCYLISKVNGLALTNVNGTIVLKETHKLNNEIENQKWTFKSAV